MVYDSWHAEFIAWYEQRNEELVEGRSSMEMIDELDRLYLAADPITKSRMTQILREWLNSGDAYQKYDARVILNRHCG